MNNNIHRLNKQIAKQCELSALEHKDDCFNELLTILSKKQFDKIKVSQNAINLCVEQEQPIADYFILPKEERSEEYMRFFENNLTIRLSPSNEAIISLLLSGNKNNKWKKLLMSQSINVYTKEEDISQSQMVELVDLWLTPKDVIDKFFALAKLNKDECFDPCACDGRWLDGQGYSIDILPMRKNVAKKDFLTMKKEELPENVKTIVGNLPFSLLDEFVNKSLELVDDCYFLVSGDTILKHFPNNIEHMYIFSGLEGNQKDNRSRCEFDVPFLIKSALWCCIVHITKKEQPSWAVESNISNEEKRDGYHIALGKNTFIKSEVPVDENERISKIPVKSSIIWKGGKKIIRPDGSIIDLKFDF